MLKSPRLDYHMNNIGIYQSLCNSYSFEHNFFNNIKMMYQQAGKCDDQKNLQYILYAAMVSTPDEVTDDSPNVRMT